MSTARPILRLVPPPLVAVPEVQFCGHCGAPPPNQLAARSRVCALCGLGVVISTGQNVAPRAREPFVIVDSSLTLCALSGTAESLLAVDEPDAINRHVSEFLEPADAEAGQGDELIRAIIAAASGRVPSADLVVRPTGEYGVRYAARVGRCGPPPAALVVLADGVV